uniref:Orf314 n=1 Tax=Cassiopea frondosa TaxID=237412 RepID=G9ISE4_CASFR|nr:orf314 [Cassiopea xamachana]AER54470.1 orf314 [Cassiopea xamachana]
MRTIRKETHLEIWTYYTPIYTLTENLLSKTLKKIIYTHIFTTTKNTIWVHYINKYYTIYTNKNIRNSRFNINDLTKKILNISYTYSLNLKHITIIHRQAKG